MNERQPHHVMDHKQKVGFVSYLLAKRRLFYGTKKPFWRRILLQGAEAVPVLCLATLMAILAKIAADPSVLQGGSFWGHPPLVASFVFLGLVISLVLTTSWEWARSDNPAAKMQFGAALATVVCYRLERVRDNSSQNPPVAEKLLYIVLQRNYVASSWEENEKFAANAFNTIPLLTKNPEIADIRVEHLITLHNAANRRPPAPIEEDMPAMILPRAREAEIIAYGSMLEVVRTEMANETL